MGQAGNTDALLSVRGRGLNIGVKDKGVKVSKCNIVVNKKWESRFFRIFSTFF